MKKNGFTAIELLIMLGVIVLISTITIPIFAEYQKTIKLENEARILATDLRLAQQLSVTEQTIYQIVINQLTNSYEVRNSQTSAIIKSVTLSPEVSIDEISGFTDDTVGFNAAGGAIETGYIVLINTKNANSTIQIKPSGYVDIIE